MRSFLKLCTGFILMMYFGQASGQFKTVNVEPGFSADKSNLIHPDFKFQAKSERTTDLPEFVIRPMDFDLVLSEYRTGLKPGIINERGVPAYIEGKLLPLLQRRTTTEGKAMDYLTAAAPLMKVNDPEQNFMITRIETDAIGMQHVRLQQIHQQIPVYGAEVILHSDGSDFDFLNGKYYPSFHLASVEPLIDELSSEELVRNDLGTITTYENNVLQLMGAPSMRSELVIYFKENTPHLVWHHTAYKNLAERWEYFSDAISGEIIEKYLSICKFHNHQPGKWNSCQSADLNLDFSVSQEIQNQNETTPLDGKAIAIARDLFDINRNINTWEAGSRFYLIDGARDIFSPASNMPNDPNGVLWTIDAFNTSPAKSNFRYDHIISINNTWPNKTSISAHYNSGKSFEYFRNVHNRKSINGNSGNIISLINVADEDGSSMGNAFWNGAAMFYGNGDGAFRELARGLDVAGHEMSHGVIQSTANLEYQGESGALNESFADVFGAMIDRDDWLIGEDVVRTNAFPSGALRSLENPHNGASTNDFNRGWQPKHYNERFTGSADNGGVHINSGIPNHAFFRFATAIGKDKAEKVYYRALTNYLTKSSKFVDCRVAVIKAATDLHGASSAEVTAARTAFDAVGILGDQSGNYEVDVNQNPGQEFLLAVGGNFSGIFLHTPEGSPIRTLTNRTVLSKPSISDDGTEIVYVSNDNHIYYITINWNTNQVQEQRLSNTAIWRNVIISKDGTKVAALTKEVNNEIVVFHFGTTTTSATFELYNPTFTAGVSTGDVLYADAMEFDLTGEFIMYDAENAIKSNSSGIINYWDIGFIKVWNNQSGTFSFGNIEKLFPALPNGISIGNPTFSKNSPYIVAFDYLEEEDNLIVCANVERGQANGIFLNNDLAFPNYSTKDDKLVFDNKSGSSTNLGFMTLKSNKIEAASQAFLLLNNRRWATYFSNGKRILSDVTDIRDDLSAFRVYPNPVHESLMLEFNSTISGPCMIGVYQTDGRLILQKDGQLIQGVNTINIPVQELNPGFYLVKLTTGADRVYQRNFKIVKN